MLYVIAAIHTLGEAQKEIITYVKELKNSIPKLSEKMSEKNCVHRETTPQEKSHAAVEKGFEKGSSFVTQEDVIAMMEKRASQEFRSLEVYSWASIPSQSPPYAIP